MSEIFLVKYSGPFAFIKPWTAVRDGYTASQQFLTPSIIEGLEKKLFPELLPNTGLSGYITRHRLSYQGISAHQERIQPRGIKVIRKMEKKTSVTNVMVERRQSIWTRGVLLNPVLWLGFSDLSKAGQATKQHLCLCRNEDILLPSENVIASTLEQFEKPWTDNCEHNFDGFELLFSHGPGMFPVGFNRYSGASPMFGRLQIIGNPRSSS